MQPDGGGAIARCSLAVWSISNPRVEPADCQSVTASLTLNDNNKKEKPQGKNAVTGRRTKTQAAYRGHARLSIRHHPPRNRRRNWRATCAHIRQYVLDDPAHHSWAPGGCPAGGAHAPGPGRPHACAPGGRRRRLRHAVPRSDWPRLRDGRLRPVDPHVHHGRVDLHEVSHLHPNSDRAVRLLEDARLLRIEGAHCVVRPGDASDLLVLLEERTESGI